MSMVAMARPAPLTAHKKKGSSSLPLFCTWCCSQKWRIDFQARLSNQTSRISAYPCSQCFRQGQCSSNCSPQQFSPGGLPAEWATSRRRIANCHERTCLGVITLSEGLLLTELSIVIKVELSVHAQNCEPSKEEEIGFRRAIMCT